MRVLHVLNTGRFSGAENVVISLIHAMEGYYECAYSSPDGPISDILNENGIIFYPIHTESINVFELKRTLDEYKPDIIHAHDYNAGIMAVLTGTKVPIINHLHNNTPWLRTICLKSVVYGLSCLRYKEILTVSDSVMEEFIFGNYLHEKTTMVGNPINLQKIRTSARKAELVDESDIVFLGRLAEQKRPVFFIDIIEEISKRIPNVRVAMVGAGDLISEIERKISIGGLQDNIRLYGFQKNPYGLVNNSKILVMPSAWEGFGLAAVEGLALGKPVVATPVGGLKNIVQSECGMLCIEKLDFVEEIFKLLSDEEYYRKKSKAAIKRANKFDNIVNYRNQVDEIYKLVSKK